MSNIITIHRYIKGKSALFVKPFKSQGLAVIIDFHSAKIRILARNSRILNAYKSSLTIYNASDKI